MKHVRLLLIFIYFLVPSFSFAGIQTYTSPGTYYFTVPAGVTNMSAIISGGGGGGGGSDGWGDNHAGGGGGSGGYISGNTNVIPGEILTITVGSGGPAASWIFNGSWVCSPNGTTWTKNGANGGNSSIKGSFGTYTSTGGQGAGGNTSDNGDGWSGAGGTPSGKAGGLIDNRRNNYCSTAGGSVISYGTGGSSNGWVSCSSWNGAICPVAGKSGIVQIWWTDPPTVNVYFSFLVKKMKSIFQ